MCPAAASCTLHFTALHLLHCRLYNTFDSITSKHHLFKVETIGDACAPLHPLTLHPLPLNPTAPAALLPHCFRASCSGSGTVALGLTYLIKGKLESTVRAASVEWI